MKQIPLTVEQKKSYAGGMAATPFSFLILLIPAIISSVVEAGIAIKHEVDASNSDDPAPSTSGSKLGFSAPKPYVRLSPFPSRSSVSYGMPVPYA